MADLVEIVAEAMSDASPEHLGWKLADEAERDGWRVLARAAVRATQECVRPPYGWACTRSIGHLGPCAAIEVR